MRRWIGYWLLAFFSFALAGVFPAQMVLRHRARREMRALIRARGSRMDGVVDLSFRLVHGQVTDAGFQWEEEEEFSFNGTLYDVIDREEQDGRITFHCIADGKESLVLQNARNTASGPGQDRSLGGCARLLVKFMCNKYLPLSPIRAGTLHTGRGMPPDLVTCRVLSGFQRGCFHPPSA